MTPRDFLLAQRAELLARFQASLRCGHSLDDLCRELQAFLNEVADLAREDSGTAATTLVDKAAMVVGGSPAMISLRARLGQLATRSRATVLILGESGVGKRHTARALHRATYPEGEWFEAHGREATPQVEQLLTTLRETTAAKADAGMTIYVDQLGEAPQELQAQLLRLLEEQQHAVRVIVSSDRPLVELAREGKLKKALLFRFSNELKLPPLSERKEDIAPLAVHFAELTASASGGRATTFSPDALALLREHHWPGNLTELRNVIERVSTNFGPGLVDAADLPKLDDRPSGAAFKLTPTGVDLAELERQLLLQALALAGNNQTRAASLLGLTRDQIRYRMAKHDLPAIIGRAE